jgi:hypothetical protein
LNDSDTTLLVEVRAHHDMTRWSALEHQGDSLSDGTTGSENTESNVGVTKWITVQHILIANLNMDVLVKLVQLLDWNDLMLHLPLWVLATVVANLGAPLLALSYADKNEGVHLVKWTATVDIKVSRHKVQVHVALLWNHEGDSLLLLWDHSNLGLHWLHVWLNHDLGLLWLNDNLRLW